MLPPMSDHLLSMKRGPGRDRIAALAATTPSTHPDVRAPQFASIAAAAGTPCYVYDAGAIRTAYAVLNRAFDGYPHAIHYALKANSSLAVVRLLQSLGSHADANSLGEVDVAMRCGFHPEQIVFTGVGKSAAEIDRAVSLGLLAINVESPGELDRIDQRAIAQNVKARVALRVNPDIDAKSHPHISTGLKSNKFGVPIGEAPALFREMSSRRGLLPVGAHVHIGSQITTLDPLEKAAQAVVGLAQALRDEGIVLQHLDMGGGLGISYESR
jgi:diaminopimelate decarboxylase